MGGSVFASFACWNPPTAASAPRAGGSSSTVNPTIMESFMHLRSGPATVDNFLRIAPDVKLGTNAAVHCFANLYGCEIGDDSRVGAFVEIQKNASIGARCKISSHTF